MRDRQEEQKTSPIQQNQPQTNADKEQKLFFRTVQPKNRR
jgi:hypothetical protein